MHILLLYQYFQSPDAPGTGRHYSFAGSWTRNHRVTVVSSTSGFTRPITNEFPSAPPGVQLKTFEVDYANRMGVLRRLLAFRRFASEAVAYGKTIDRPDVVFGTSTPLSVAWAAREIARFWDVPWVFEVRDLWPDFPIEMGAVPTRWLQNRLRSFESGLYRDADHIIPLSPDMRSHIVERTGSDDRVTTLLNGTSFELLKRSPESQPEQLRAKYALNARRVVLYAGALGRANGIPIILEAAERLRAQKDIVFVFAGAGHARPDVERAAAGAPNIIAIPAMPKHKIFAWHRLADLSLVTFIDRPVLASNSPSKFFDSLSSGTPVLVTNQGWTQRFVEDHDCGWTIDRLEAASLAQAIETICSEPETMRRRGRNGALIAREQFDRQKMADEIEGIMSELIHRASGT